MSPPRDVATPAGGPKPVLVGEKLRHALEMHERGVPTAEIARALSVGRATLYRSREFRA